MIKSREAVVALLDLERGDTSIGFITRHALGTNITVTVILVVPSLATGRVRAAPVEPLDTGVAHGASLLARGLGVSADRAGCGSAFGGEFAHVAIIALRLTRGALESAVGAELASG